MMLVDDRDGSNTLYPYISEIAPNDAIMTRIDCGFGDIVWDGNGPTGTVSVGVEYKKLDELFNSITTGRFMAHQFIGMVNNYQHRYLLVEYGNMRVDRVTGQFQYNRGGKWLYFERGGRTLKFQDLEQWYGTVEEFGQFKVVKTKDEYESARWAVARHKWWLKEWKDHKAVHQFYTPPPPSALLVKPSLVRRVAKELGAVGWDRSIAVATRFKNVREMINADEKQWMEVDGIGKTIATRVVAEITGGK